MVVVSPDDEEGPSFFPLSQLMLQVTGGNNSNNNDWLSSLPVVMIDNLTRNIIDTFDSVISDLNELFPTQFEDTMTNTVTRNTLSALLLFQKLSVRCFDELLKPWYRMLHSDNRLTLHTALSLFQFICKFAGRLDAYGDFSSTTTTTTGDSNNNSSSNNNNLSAALPTSSSSNSLVSLATSSSSMTASVPLISASFSQPALGSGHHYGTHNKPPHELGHDRLRNKMREKWRIKKLELFKAVAQCVVGDVQHQLVQHPLKLPPSRALVDMLASSSPVDGTQVGHGWAIVPPSTPFLLLLRRCDEVATAHSLSFAQQQSLVANPSASSSLSSSSSSLSLSTATLTSGYPNVHPEHHWASHALQTVTHWTQQLMKCDDESLSSLMLGQTTTIMATTMSSTPQDVRLSLLHTLLDALLKHTVPQHRESLSVLLAPTPSLTLSSASMDTLSFVFVSCFHAHARYAQAMRPLWDHALQRLPQHSDADCRHVESLAAKCVQYQQAHKDIAVMAMERFVDVCLQDTEVLLRSALLFQATAPAMSTTSATTSTLSLFKSNPSNSSSSALSPTATTSAATAATAVIGSSWSQPLPSWDKDVAWIYALKKWLLSRVLVLCQMWSDELVRLRLRCSAEDAVLKIVHHVLQSTITLYLQFLCADSQTMHIHVYRVSPSTSANSATTTTVQHEHMLSRLCEDLHLLVAMIEDIRSIVTTYFASQQQQPRPATALSSLSLTPNTSGKGDGMAMLSRIEQLHNKQSFDELAQPLIQLSMLLTLLFRYAPTTAVVSFVNNELTQCFGSYAIHLWQLVCHWRGDKREAIVQSFETHFRDSNQRKTQQRQQQQQHQQSSSSTSVRKDGSGECIVDVSFLTHVKAANIVSLK
jgi:hypothetical protein